MVASDRSPRGARIAKARTAWRWPAAATIAIGASMLSGTVAAGDVYLRAGIGLDRPAETAFTDRNCSSTAPAALYGCGRGGDGAPYRSRGDFGAVPVLDVGLGYLAAPAARLEVLVEYPARFSFEGHARVTPISLSPRVGNRSLRICPPSRAWWPATSTCPDWACRRSVPSGRSSGPESASSAPGSGKPA